MACTVKTKATEMLVINFYNQASTFLGFEALTEMLRKLSTPILHLPTLVVTDANLHSPLWNPETYASHDHDADADRLVEIMNDWNLYLRSPKGVSTYESKSGMQSGVTIDLVWVDPKPMTS